MCAQRYRQWDPNHNVPHLLTGQCYLLGDDLNVDQGTEDRTWRRVVCEDRHLSQNPKNQDWFAYCQQGHGASFAKDGKSLLFGAPGAYQWTGEEGKKQLQVLFFLFLSKPLGFNDQTSCNNVCIAFHSEALLDCCYICFPCGLHQLCTSVSQWVSASYHMISSAKTCPPQVDDS